MQGHRAPQDQGVTPRGAESFPGNGALLRTWIPSPGDKALSEHGIIPEEMESILGKLSLQIFPAAQQLWPQASFPRQHLGCAMLSCAGRGIAGQMGLGLGRLVF